MTPPPCPADYVCQYLMTPAADFANGREVWLAIAAMVAIVVVLIGVLYVIHNRAHR